jgi:hypothetical protein
MPPANRREKPGGNDESWFKPQGSQGDERKDMKQGGRLEVEAWWLLILDVEAPDQNHQKRDIDRC